MHNYQRIQYNSRLLLFINLDCDQSRQFINLDNYTIPDNQ
jgi:hypothetical protein